MKYPLVALALVSIALVLAAGCTGQPSLPPTSGTTPATATPTLTPTGGMGLVPSPTDVVPPAQQVAVQVSKNTVSTNPWISVLFAGGSGQSSVVTMTSTVIRSDGGTETKSARSPAINTNLLFNGTTRTDRVVVDITYTDGKTYKVKDELVPFQNINP